MTANVKGFAVGAVAAAAYGMNPLFTLPLYKAGMGPGSVLFFRYSVALVLLGAIMFFTRVPFRLPKKAVLPTLFAGTLIALSSLALFESYLRMDAGLASTILFAYPVMVAVIMGVFYHEKMSIMLLGGILLAVVGIVLLGKGGGGAHVTLEGVALSLAIRRGKV